MRNPLLPPLVFLLTLTYLPDFSVHAQERCEPPAALISSQRPNIFTDEQEVDLGDAIAEHIIRNFRVISDDDLTFYLNRIGERLIRHLPPNKLRFQFFLIDLPDVNAFVLPGGRIYVSRKLVAFSQNEDELAGVIAHELGHLVARQATIDMTRLLREVLNIIEVSDRRDIFAKYNQLLDNAARKPRAFRRSDSHEEKEQIVADQIGLFALASAGYDPHAHARLWDRYAETKGKTGGFFSDLFGTTKPEVRRLREMIRGTAALPRACIEARILTPEEDFKIWQAAVVTYTGLGRKEALRGVVSKTRLEPALRGEITHTRFSPDGRHLLAQDDSGINVLSRDPFTPLFRIEAPEASPAQFTPDSERIVFHNSNLRVEVWKLSEENLETAHELVVRTGCIQTELSPDGTLLACLDSDMALNLFEVTTSKQIFQKKSFYQPSFLELFLLRIMRILEGEDAPGTEWINMSFAPDGRYFAAGKSSTAVNPIGVLVRDHAALIIDLGNHKSIQVRGPLRKLIAGGFAFAGSDRLVGVDEANPNDSAVVAFPSGEVIERFPLRARKLETATRGDYLFLRPVAGYAVGVMDLKEKKLFKGHRQPAIDIYEDVFVAERIDGELGLYDVEKNDVIATVALPRNSFGRLRATALSYDLKWLAVSERKRGAVWDLTKGERIFHVRGFRGGHFADGSLFADFPKFDNSERTMGRLSLTTREMFAELQITEPGARQHGPFVLITKPAKKDGDYRSDVIAEMRESATLSTLWFRHFPKESPQIWVSPQESTMVLMWSVSSTAAKNEIKANPELSRQLAQLKEKEGDYYLEVLDARKGTVTGRLLIETGKGSFRIDSVFASGDWLVISDTQNRILLYSLSSGQQRGKLFGYRATISQKGLLCVENERGQLSIYDLETMEKRDELTFSTGISLMRFGLDGQSLFVLTSNQTAYVLDVSHLLK